MTATVKTRTREVPQHSLLVGRQRRGIRVSSLEARELMLLEITGRETTETTLETATVGVLLTGGLVPWAVTACVR